MSFGDEVLVITQIGLGLKMFVQNILDFASIVNGTFTLQRKKVNVSDAIEAVCNLFSMKCRQKRILIVQECLDDLFIYSDFNRICGCLYNFVDNSVKFTQKGGITVQAMLERQDIVFRIIDTGIGIDQSDIQTISKIFNDPLIEAKTKNSAGLGIGLRISHSLLKKLNNGEVYIRFYSEKGSGTTIEFRITQGSEENKAVLPSKKSLNRANTAMSKITINSIAKTDSLKVLFSKDRKSFNQLQPTTILEQNQEDRLIRTATPNFQSGITMQQM